MESAYKIIYDDFNDDLDLIINMKKVKCDILEYGFKQRKMEFYFCNCDPDQKNPICQECANICHQGHILSKLYIDYQSCQCGLKNHRLANEISTENIYIPTCFFQEIAIQSKSYLHYEVLETGENICFFCFTFCRSYVFKDRKIIKKKTLFTDTTCDCPYEGHKDIKYIYQNINNLFDKDSLCCGEMKPINFLNTIFKTDKLLKNIYSSFITYIYNLETNINNSNFEFDTRMSYSNFYWALQNISTVSKRIKSLYYFSDSIKQFFHVKFTFDILDKKFDYNNTQIWQFKSFFVKCFSKLILSSELRSYSQFKVDDFENFTPLQRLILTSNLKKNSLFCEVYIENYNIIEKMTATLTTINKNMSGTISEFAYNLISNILGILKKLAKFYLFTNDQILKYCNALDDLFHKSINLSKRNRVIKREEKIETKTLLVIIKTLLFFAFGFNDKMILGNLTDNITVSQTKFFHTKNEVGKSICKICINVLNQIRVDSNMNVDDKTKKVLVYSTQLLSLCLNNSDFYLCGLKRSVVPSIESYMKHIRNTSNFNEQQFINYLDTATNELELNYNEYFNFTINIESLNLQIKKIINDFFSHIKAKDFLLPNNSFSLLSENFIHSNQNNHQGRKELAFFKRKAKTKQILPVLENDEVQFDHCYKALMIRSNFIFSICKFFDVTNFLTHENDYDEVTSELILRLLYYFIMDNPENCIIALSSNILKPLTNASVSNYDKVLDFIYTCINIIAKNNIEIPFPYKFIKYLTYMLFKSAVKLFIKLEH
jgi:hypothetical protein